MSARCSTLVWGSFVSCGMFLLSPTCVHGADRDAGRPDGRELFTREWLPDDPRSAAGDGLGPVFNDTSCVGCHNQGGVGGAGPVSKNAQVATAFSGLTPISFTFSFGPAGKKVEAKPDRTIKRGEKEDGKTRLARESRIVRENEQLEKIHPGFLTARSVVLQRFSTDADYDGFRNGIVARGTPLNFAAEYSKFAERIFKQALADKDKDKLPALTEAQSDEFFRAIKGFSGAGIVQHTLGDVIVLVSERNTPALFGSGLIDAIPDDVLLAAAKRKHAGYPEVSGRVARLKDGRLGRFGWKAQKADLQDFVLNACATELGLEVPDNPQAILPNKLDYKAPGPDMTERECTELVSFVNDLPKPAEALPREPRSRDYLAQGRKLFDWVGCAACHTPELGEVNGLYSDLLLHDLGPQLSDAGAYGAALNATEEEELKQPLPALIVADPKAKPLKPADEAKLIGALRQEWRTPPLWGLRDSAPYLHDGRAATIDQAIALHDGEAQRSTRQFFKLSAEEKLQLTSFLRSLVAPE